MHFLTYYLTGVVVLISLLIGSHWHPVCIAIYFVLMGIGILFWIGYGIYWVAIMFGLVRKYH